VASYSAEGQASEHPQHCQIADYSPIAALLRAGDTLVLDTQSRARTGPEIAPLVERLGQRSAILIALRDKGDAVGLLCISHDNPSYRFSRAEVNFAQTLGSQIAAAVANARLASAEERRAYELEQIQAFSQRIEADLSLEEMLATIMDGIQALIGGSGALLSLFDTDGQAVHAGLARGLPSGVAPAQSQAAGLTAWLARNRRALRLADFQHPPARPLFGALADGAAIRSYLGMPVLIDEQFVGTIELYSAKPNRFSAHDERLLKIAASQAGQAISKVQRYEQADEHLRSRLQQLTALQRISRQLTSNLSLNHILGFTLEEALRATGASAGYIALREGFAFEEAMRAFTADEGPRPHGGEPAANERIRVIAANGYGEEEHQRLLSQIISGSATVAEQAMTSGEPVLMDDLADDDRLGAIGQRAAAALAVPIYYEAQVVGVVNLHSTAAHTFDHDALEFVRALADQTALAIGNTQRYNDQVRQRELLQQRANLLKEVLDIGQALRTDRSVEEVLEQIAFSISDTVGYRAVVINLVAEDDPSSMRIVAGAGLPLDELNRLRQGAWSVDIAQRFLDPRFRLGRCFFVPEEEIHKLEADVDLSGVKTVSITDERTENEWQASDALFVPLYSTRGRLLGLISVDNPYDRQRPSRRSVESLEIYAQQAAIAIENLSLLKEARTQAAQMTALARASAATVSTLDLNDLLERVYEEIAA